VRVTLSVGRWFAAGFFFAVAGAAAYMAWLMFHAISHSDTSAGYWITMGILLFVLTVGALICGVWVWRHWRGGPSSA
jgi:hypothetical protein